ncbi:MAG: hypothetical protein M5T61_05550 [Acidimicrobiia bacterium]|nr:hypothetical protein [Acidimicrobiia bacterium]
MTGDGVGGRDVLLTGPGRSGTTLVCHLLNRLPQTVALNEPLAPGRVMRDDPVASIAEFVAMQRRRILETGTAVTRGVEGSVTSDPVAARRSGLARVVSLIPGRFAARRLGRFATREVIAERGPMQIEKDLSPSFTLVVKQPGSLTALLGDLVGRFPCFAIVRNPLAILASWNSVDFRADGRAPIPERLDPDLKQRLDACRDRFDRQVALLDWGFRRYEEHLQPGHLLTYEDLVATGGRCLQVITPEAAALEGALESRNRNKAYDRRLVPMLAERLLATDGAFWGVYTRSEVEALAAEQADASRGDR